MSTSLPKLEEKDAETNLTVTEVVAARSASVASTSNTLSVPDNVLLANVHRPKSMIPLRTRAQPPAGQSNDRSRPVLRERTPTPNYHAVKELSISANKDARPAKQFSLTPTIAVTSHSPAAAKFFVTPSTSSLRDRDSATSSMKRAQYTTELYGQRTYTPIPADHDESGTRTPSGTRPVSGQSIRRKPVYSASRPKIFDDATVQQIFNGPYATSPSQPSRLAGADKENSPNVSMPRSLRIKKSTGNIGGSSVTGGQRMADEWLKKRMTGGVYGAALGGSPDGRSATGSPAYI